VEATANIAMTLKAIKNAGARAGLAVKPGTEISDYEDYADLVDMFLIMTVEPGFGGQSFMENMLPKISRARKIIGDRPIWLQVDGGISPETIEMAAAAGADTFVAGSAVFRAQDPAAMVSKLRTLAEAVAQ
jgi:ribulose-phosphate 3-epimerase